MQALQMTRPGPLALVDASFGVEALDEKDLREVNGGGLFGAAFLIAGAVTGAFAIGVIAGVLIYLYATR